MFTLHQHSEAKFQSSTLEIKQMVSPTLSSLSPAGASVSAVGEDADHGCRSDPCSGLQGSGRTLSQLSDPTNHQQAAALHQQPHSAGEHKIATPSPKDVD